MNTAFTVLESPPRAGRRIAAICATPRELNTGMRLVDLALKRILDQADLLESTDFFCFDVPDYLREDPSGIRYRSILDAANLDAYDAIIIWGDFIITRKYLETLALSLSRSRKLPPETVRDALLQRVLLRDFKPEALSRVIVFGQNIFLDKSAIFSDEPYLTALRKLLTHARVARLRDPISAYCASNLTGLPPGRFAGVDAALLVGLLAPPPAAAFDGEVSSSQRVGLFFDRTGRSLATRTALALGMRLKGRFEPVWIPWFPPLKNPSLIDRALFGIRQAARPVEIGDYLAEVRRCRFIVTDAYHLCLTAWAQGVPAIAIGRGAQKFKSTVSDKKKEILYLANHLDEMYLFCDNPLSNIFRRRIGKALDLAQDRAMAQGVRERMMVMAAENLELIRSALTTHS
jgi:hypothetical protein